MILPTLLLTISTCLSSGISNIVEANKIATIKEQATQIVIDAADNFNFNNFTFNYGNYVLDIKEHLYEFNRDNSLIDATYVKVLDKILYTDYKFVSNFDLDSACIVTLVAMFVFEYLKKGFAIGWKVHNIFNWEWYCGEFE